MLVRLVTGNDYSGKMVIKELVQYDFSKVEGGLELGCWKEFARARDLTPGGTEVGRAHLCHDYCH